MRGQSVPINQVKRGVETVKDAEYTASWGETVPVDPTGGAVTINLPTAVGNAGRRITVKEVGGSTNQITVDGHEDETIDGQATVASTTARNAMTFESDGSDVLIV